MIKKRRNGSKDKDLVEEADEVMMEKLLHVALGSVATDIILLLSSIGNFHQINVFLNILAHPTETLLGQAS